VTRALRWIGIGVLVLLALAAAGVWLGRGPLGERQHAGTPLLRPRVAESTAAGQPGPELTPAGAKQILFGDLHVHTTFSADAFMLSLPMSGGEGAHPPADACDFARFCSALDFWSINDHAEGLTPRQWAETKQAVRQCNAAAGEGGDPDLVTFLGWEWTQIGATPEDHYGHKNVVLRDTEEERVPPRPISSRLELFPRSTGARPVSAGLRFLLIAASPGSDDRQPYHDLARFLQDRADVPSCAAEVPTRELPSDCQEAALTPADLFQRLRDWSFPHMVIPHGNTWGIYTPPGTTWDKQLAAHEDPARDEPLIEVFSGHGNIEPYRAWRAVQFDAEGRARCPEASEGYTPECMRAGEIIRERCLAEGAEAGECEARAAEARQNHADAGLAGHLTVPGAQPEDWLDSGQCTDCYLPAYHYRPGSSVQYALAIRDFPGTGEAQREPKAFRFGFIGSSDVHTGRPGTGYKDFDRTEMSDARLSRVGPPRFSSVDPAARSVARPPGSPATPDFERFGSFFGTAGLVAVHSPRRDRGAIWDALERREVYGTSGDRMLLWFDLLDAGAAAAGSRPMGSEVRTTSTPRFRVRAVGAPEQLPGCPASSAELLGSERLARLCRGECYHPSDQRRVIERIEVVRIRPQVASDEPVERLIEDPWLVRECPADPAGCALEFSDPEYAASGRDATYYVRAIQAPTPTINADGLRCQRDAEGRCVSTRPCFGDERTDPADDCLAEAGERAWSSPIYLVHAGTLVELLTPARHLSFSPSPGGIHDRLRE
jgi:hypothetical protein